MEGAIPCNVCLLWRESSAVLGGAVKCPLCAGRGAGASQAWHEFDLHLLLALAGGGAEEVHDLWKIQMAKAAITSSSHLAAVAEPDLDVKEAVDWISRFTPEQARRAH